MGVDINCAMSKNSNCRIFLYTSTGNHWGNALCQDFSKKNLEQCIRSSDAELKNSILVADRIELPTFSENG